LFFKQLKDLKTLGVEVKEHVLFCKIKQKSYNAAIVFNKLLVEIAKA